MRNEPQIFKQKKLEIFMFFLICSVLVTSGILMLKDKILIGWFIIFLFGLGMITSLIQFHPNASYLKLTDEGFETKSLFRSNFTKWTDIKEFRLGHIKGSKMIFFDYTDEYKKGDNGKKTAKFMSGERVLPSYNISTDKLIELMIEYKLKSKNVAQHRA